MTVIQLWRSLYSKVITLANRNVKEGLGEKNIQCKNKRKWKKKRKEKQTKRKRADWLCWVIRFNPLFLFFSCFTFQVGVKTKGQSEQLIFKKDGWISRIIQFFGGNSKFSPISFSFFGNLIEIYPPNLFAFKWPMSYPFCWEGFASFLAKVRRESWTRRL